MIYSLARQRKFDFCRRAFYFQYELSEISPWRSDLVKWILDLRFQKEAHLAIYSLLVKGLRKAFYEHGLSHRKILRDLYAQALSMGVSEREFRELGDRLRSFTESEFYQKTAEYRVNYVPTDEVESVFIGDVELLGKVDFAWFESCGTLHLVNYGSRGERDLSFAVHYALKKHHVTPAHLNIGTLYEREGQWQVNWQEIDWGAFEELQEAALSFELPSGVEGFSLTEDGTRCQNCRFQRVCDEFSADLEV